MLPCDKPVHTWFVDERMRSRQIGPVPGRRLFPKGHPDTGLCLTKADGAGHDLARLPPTSTSGTVL